MPKILFRRQDVQQEVSTGTDLTTVQSLHAHVPLKFGCRTGQCGVCAIRIVEGAHNLTRKGPKEALTLSLKGLTEDYRLACQCALNGDITVE